MYNYRNMFRFPVYLRGTYLIKLQYYFPSPYEYITKWSEWTLNRTSTSWTWFFPIYNSDTVGIYINYISYIPTYKNALIYILVLYSLEQDGF